jgi:predicted O-methyltransferase YrrM
MKVVKARKVFEFGTYLGSTTYNLALNTNADIFTVDMDEKTALKTLLEDDDPEQADMITLKSIIKPEFFDTPEKYQIDCIYGDVRTLDFSRFDNVIDLVLIDDHPNCVERSTQWADRMVNKKLGCIVWHDYRDNPPTRKPYIDMLPTTIYHIAESALCFKPVGFDL